MRAQCDIDSRRKVLHSFKETFTRAIRMNQKDFQGGVDRIEIPGRYSGRMVMGKDVTCFDASDREMLHSGFVVIRQKFYSMIIVIVIGSL